MDSIGKRIKRKRIELEFSQEKLALLCGWEFARSRIANYESGLREPTLQDVIKLSRALKVTPCWLAFGD